MAEILGIVAGATQLLDLSARLVLASSQLYTSLKNAPEEIEALKKNTQDFYDLLWMISSDLDGPLNSHPNSLHVTHRIVSIFNDAMKESEDLAILLERLSNKSSSSAKRLWSSVAGLKEKTDIADRGRRIESLKASIQMWYQHQSIMRLRVVEHQLSTITRSQLATQSNLSLLTQQSARVIDMNQSLAMKLHSYDRSGADSTQFSPQVYRRKGRNRSCTCTPSITVSHVSKWHFQLFLDRQTTHSTECSLHTDSTIWSFGLRALRPRIQVMLGLQLGGRSLSMIGRISPHCVVDPSQSPAFVALEDAVRELRRFPISLRSAMLETTPATSNGLSLLVYKRPLLDSTHQKHIESTCETLRSRLLQAFSSGRASPADRTPEGITVLSQFLLFATYFYPYQETLVDILSSTLEILIPNDTGSVENPQHTLLGLMGVKAPDAVIRLQHLRLDGILISHGLEEMSNGFRRFLSRTNFVGIFNKHPCLLENYGQNPVHLAIMQRSESKLRELLDLGKVGLEIDNPPLISLAIAWPAGLKMLLNAGADPSNAIQDAILQQQLQSISLLLDHGCPMFGPVFCPYKDVLGMAIGSRVSPDVVFLLIERLIERRQELLQLALDHLPEAVIETSWYNYHAQPRPLLDYNAIEIYNKLKSHCIRVPEALWPGPYPTIYHGPSVHESASLAMKLYKLGFHDIDKSDDYRTTPLIQAIKVCGGPGRGDCLQLIEWYLDMGVALPCFLTHVLSLSIRLPAMISAGVWISQDHKLYGVLDIFRRLIHGDAQTHDDCRCWCSATGCHPVGVVLRNVGPIERYHLTFQPLRRRRWLYLLPRYSSLGLDLDQNCFTEICRLEIFDRLGMAHTCCHRLAICPQNHFPLPSDELKEFQEEDQSLKEALDLYVELYANLLREHQGSFEGFWISWWFAVDHFLPFDHPKDNYWEQEFPTLHLPGFPKDELFSKAQDTDRYNPPTAALTSRVHSCVTLLDSRTIDTFLSQLKQPL